MKEQLIHKIPRKFRKPIYSLVATAATGIAATCGGSDNKTQPVPNTGNRPTLDYAYKFPWAEGETWYLTSGPHADGLSNGVQYAVDFAPSEIVNCVTGHEVIANRQVRAAEDGKVIVSGDENNPNDSAHSIVVVEQIDGYESGYMHLANIQVKKGQSVKQGDTLGSPSCEYPPGGKNTGAHLHFFLAQKQVPVDITRLQIDGWDIQSAPGADNGTMTKANEAKRTADVRRCGPDVLSINACGGIRNDLTNVSLNKISKPNVAPTMAQVPTEKLPTPQDPIEAGWREAEEKTRQFIGLLQTGTPEAIQEAFNMQMTPEVQQTMHYGSYHTAIMDWIRDCADEMHRGEFQLKELVRRQTNVAPIRTETDRLNAERGLNPPERFAIGVNFRDRAYNSYGRIRTGFADFDTYVDNTYINFQRYNGQLQIIDPKLCMTRPLGKVVGQDPNQ